MVDCRAGSADAAAMVDAGMNDPNAASTARIEIPASTSFVRIQLLLRDYGDLQKYSINRPGLIPLWSEGMAKGHLRDHFRSRTFCSPC
jgi:hypothetical protein